MFIYIGGPYRDRADSDDRVNENISKANEAAREVARKGHVPFVPHTMMRNWHKDKRVSQNKVLIIGCAWLGKCTARSGEIAGGFLYLGPSEGADIELAMAKVLGLQVFTSIDQIPDVTDQTLDATLEVGPVTQEILTAYLSEYEECAECYRHTYQTIWQASAFFAAISTALFGVMIGFGQADWLIALVSPVPFLLWYWAIFRPMDSYGEWRSERCAGIEQTLNKVPGLNMRHFTEYEERRKQKRKFREKVLHPRVKEVINVVGGGALVAWLGYSLALGIFSLVKWLTSL